MARGRGPTESKAQSRARDRVLAINSGAGRGPILPSSGKQDAADVYQELLTEAISGESEGDRPLKKRRVAHSRARPVSEGQSTLQSAGDSKQNREQQVITITDSERSDESDLDWEEIGFDGDSTSRSVDKDAEIEDVSVEVGGRTTPKKAAAVRRKPATTAEKLIRIAAHKSHLLLLLFHVHVRNAWCHSSAVEKNLRTVLSPRIIGMLNPNPEWPQLRRSDSLMDGLKLAVDLWRAKFNVTESGMQRAQWFDDEHDIKQRIKQIQHDISSVEKSDFIRAATTLRGSQDVGNQLFCALLRAVGVEARLVCSLQTLPLATAGQKGSTPQKQKAVVYADADSEAGTTSAEDGSVVGSGSDSGKRTIVASRKRRRIGQPSLGMPMGTYQATKASPQKKKVHKQEYPIFWIEVFNTPYQKWFPVDATVTYTVSKANKLEPPLSSPTNNFLYAIAFEEDGTAHDVTRRYARSYNAKTLKQRIESTSNGAKWLNNALRPFRRHHALNRDQVESAELARKEASEGLPASVQDFKNHPVYALERHLKRHEVIAPKRQVGKINAGKAAGLEPVYRRSDVQTVRSAEKWYRLGREIKAGEQALKHVTAPRRAREESEDEGDARTALYAFSQTEPYIPPPVVGGRVPRNGFGNLDVYVPSMVPAGGTHVRHPLAAKAARLIGVDFVDAVTGFTFKGRHGTAVVAGVVVASQYKDAVESVIESFEYEAETQEQEAKSLESLRLWKRFLTGLRIAKRIGLEHGHVNEEAETDGEITRLREELDQAEDEEEETFEAGGFFPDSGMDDVAQPTSQRDYADPVEANTVGPRLRRKRRVQFEDEDEDESGVDDTYEDESSYQPQTKQRQPPGTRRRSKMITDDNEHEIDVYDPNADGLKPSGASSTEQLGNEGQAEHYDHAYADKSQEMASHDHAGEGGFMPDYNDNLGGGFIQDGNRDTNMDFEGDGGGFLPEDGIADEGHEDVDHVEPSRHRSDDHVVTNHEEGGGFLIDDEKVESMVSGGLPDERVEQDGNAKAAEAGGGFVVEYEDEDEGEHDGNTKAVHERVSQVDETDIDAHSSSADERGSLLSHDPDDDDAEPDWLV